MSRENPIPGESPYGFIFLPILPGKPGKPKEEEDGLDEGEDSIPELEDMIRRLENGLDPFSKRTSLKKVALVAGIVLMSSLLLWKPVESAYKFLYPKPQDQIVWFTENYVRDSLDISNKQFLQKMDDASKNHRDVVMILVNTFSPARAREYFQDHGWEFPTSQTLDNPLSHERLNAYLKADELELVSGNKAIEFARQYFPNDSSSLFPYLASHPNIHVIIKWAPLESMLLDIRSEYAYLDAMRALYFQRDEVLFFQYMNLYLRGRVASAILSDYAVADSIKDSQERHPHAAIFVRRKVGLRKIQEMVSKSTGSQSEVTEITTKNKPPDQMLEEMYEDQLLNGQQIPHSARKVLLTIPPINLVKPFFKSEQNPSHLDALIGLFQNMSEDQIDQLTKDIRKRSDLFKSDFSINDTPRLSTLVAFWLSGHGFITPEIKSHLIIPDLMSEDSLRHLIQIWEKESQSKTDTPGKDTQNDQKSPKTSGRAPDSKIADRSADTTDGSISDTLAVSPTQILMGLIAVRLAFSLTGATHQDAFWFFAALLGEVVLSAIIFVVATYFLARGAMRDGKIDMKLLLVTTVGIVSLVMGVYGLWPLLSQYVPDIIQALIHFAQSLMNQLHQFLTNVPANLKISQSTSQSVYAI
ncbi:MAG: hypothetical protein HYY63_06900, partial [Elusimicrobia bacterium]|nr:hypothetical protein [Elusimicrobiota bacterium]